ncbi:MAG: AAA family ATPase, partial [Anaerolineae bacterium]|nr:AAA family ATPase [Anaerolineae bacterium]
MARLSLTLSGGFDAALGGTPVTDFVSNKVRALLAFLAVESGRVHRRESLATLLWPGYPERSARTNLRNALANLRTVIADREAEPPFLLITREMLQFDRASDYRLDVEIVDETVRALEGATIDQLVEAAELYQGDFLAGFTLEDAVGFDDWASVTGERLRRQTLELLGKLVDRLEAAGELDRALAYARRRVELEPWLEAAQRQLIRLLAQTSRRSAALRQYRQCVRILEEELGAAPAAATTALYEEIRSSAGPELPIRSEPPHAVQVRPPSFLDPGASQAAARAQVFVGRAPELARLAGYLEAASAGQGQVAFVVGGPGRGKTSLLRAFAEQAMAAHPDLLVVSGACNAYSGVGDAYLPFREALGMLAGDVESRWKAGAVSRDHAQRLWSALPVTLPAMVAHGPYVIDSFVSGIGLMSRAEQAGLGDATSMAALRTLSNRTATSGLEQQALFQQVTNTLQAVAVEHPLLIVLDDLQWIDQGSIGLLFHLGRRLAGCRILLVGAYRPEEVAAGRTSGGESEPHPLTKTLNEFRRDFGDVWIDLRQADQSEGRQFVDAL